MSLAARTPLGGVPRERCELRRRSFQTLMRPAKRFGVGPSDVERTANFGPSIAMAWSASVGICRPIPAAAPDSMPRSEEHTSELQSLMRHSYAVLCLKNKKLQNKQYTHATK